MAEVAIEGLTKTYGGLIAVDDLSGEREPLNLPGVPPARHPSWTRRSRIPIDELGAQRIARSAVAAVPAERRSEPGTLKGATPR